MQKKDEAAEEELRDVLEHAPEMVAAYDLLSEVCLSKKDAAAAQAALLQGVAISGKTVRRQQKLGELAHANGDLDTARAAFTQALEKGRHSIFITPSDFGNLCRVQLEQGDLKAVADTLRKNKSSLQDSPEGQLVMAVTQGMACIQDGKLQEAAKILDAAGALRAAGTRGDDQLVLDMARVCMATGRLDEADGLVSEVARNSHDSDALLAKAKRIYEEAGRSDAGAAVLSSATSGVRKLNNEGVVLAQRGDYQTAVEKLLTACDEAPYNPRIMMNTVWVILKYLDESGMDEKRLEHARHYLAEAGRQAPDHPRLPGLRLQLKEIEKRFGIQKAAQA
jgi:tetratricopeptide (TPR) repeat protein